MRHSGLVNSTLWVTFCANSDVEVEKSQFLRLGLEDDERYHVRMCVFVGPAYSLWLMGHGVLSYEKLLNILPCTVSMPFERLLSVNQPANRGSFEDRGGASKVQHHQAPRQREVERAVR